MIVELLSATHPILQKTILLSRPTCDALSLFNLLRCATENISDNDDGFTGVRLSIPVFERLRIDQIQLYGDETRIAETEVDRLLERLRVRMGEESVLSPQLIESHLPEKSFRYVPGISRACPSEHVSQIEPVPCKARPLHLLPEPVEVRCTTAPLREVEGLLASFTLDGAVYSIIHVSGPERIAGMWWEGRNKTRDYFDVEDSTGRRFWVFRVAETRRWFLHGFFDG